MCYTSCVQNSCFPTLWPTFPFLYREQVLPVPADAKWQVILCVCVFSLTQHLLDVRHARGPESGARLCLCDELSRSANALSAFVS